MRNFLGLRAAYAVAVLELVPSCLQQSLTNSKVEGSNEALLTQVVKDISTAVQLLRRLGGEKQHDELVVMDVSASDWTSTWVKLLVGAQSISQPSFTARTDSQWATYKTDQTKKLMKKNLDELRKMAKPFLLKATMATPPADPSEGTATVGDAAANQAWVRFGPVWAAFDTFCVLRCQLSKPNCQTVLFDFCNLRLMIYVACT